MTPRPWWRAPGPGDALAPAETEDTRCASCGGTGVGREASWPGETDDPCGDCEGTGYASPSSAADLGDL